MFFASVRWFHTFFASGSAIFCSQKMQPTSYLWQLGWLFCLHFNTFHRWLVVSNMFYCPFHIWDVILPIDSYFSSCLKPPARGSHVLDPGPGLSLSLFSVVPKNETPKMAGHCHLALCCDPQRRVRWMRSSSAMHNRSRERWTSQPRRACRSAWRSTTAPCQPQSSKGCMASCLWSIHRGMSLAGLLRSLLWDRSSDSSTRLFAAMGHSDK